MAHSDMSKIGKHLHLGLLVASILALSVIWLGTSQAAERPKQTTIPLSIDSENRLHVYLTIGGEKVIGVIDTAATFPLVDTRAFEQGRQRETNQKVEILGVNGKRLFDVVELEQLLAGNQRFDNLLAARNDRLNFPGPKNILPAMRLQGRVLDFNFLRNRLDIYDRPPMRSGYYERSKIAYHERTELPFIEVQINGVTGLALIDTGSDSSYINSAFADRAGLSEILDSRHQLVGADGNLLHIRAINVRRFKLGKFRYRKFAILSADTEIFTHLGLQDHPTMVIGMDILRGYRMQMDRETKNFHFLKPRSQIIEQNVVPSRARWSQ